MPSGKPARYRFDDFELDARSYVLNRAGEPVELEPRVFELLAYLVEHHGRTVSKEELLEEVWLGQAVVDGVLARAVHGARSALGDSSRDPLWIRTVHGRGYVFAGAVERVENEEARDGPRRLPSVRHTVAITALAIVALLAAIAWWWSRPDAPTATGDVAILPFANATGDTDNDWVRLGLMDQLGGRLRYDAGLLVVPTEQTLTLLDALGIEPRHNIPPADLSRIAGGLGVDRLISGVVSTSVGLFRLQLTVHGEGSAVHSHSETGEDLLTLAAEMSHELTGRLGRRRPKAKRPASSPAVTARVEGADLEAAYALAKGVHRLLSDDPGSARSFFEAALDRDSKLVEARFRLAESLLRLGQSERAREEAEWALELAAADDDPALEARLEGTLGRIAMHQGAYEEGIERFHRSLDLFTETGDVRGRIDTLNELGLAASQRADWEQAETYHREALDLCVDLEYLAGIAAAEHGLGVVSGRRGELAAADRHFERELSLRRQLGDRSAEARTLHNLAANAQNRGDWERAEELHLRALHLRREVDDLNGVAATLVNLAVTRTWRGELASADGDAGAALEAFRELDNPRGEAMALYVRAYVAKDRGRWAEAHALTEEARSIWQSLGASNREPLVLATRAEIADEAGDAAAAERFAAEAQRLVDELGDRNLQAYALRVRGRAARLAGDAGQAEELLRRALEVAREVGNEGIEGSILTDLSEFLLDEDRVDEAAQMVEDLVRRFPQSGPAALLEARLLRARGDEPAACSRAAEARKSSRELWDAVGEGFLAACAHQGDA